MDHPHDSDRLKPRTDEPFSWKILKAAPIGIFVIKNRALLFVNDALCAVLGYGESDLVGRSTRILYDSEDEFQRIGRELYGEESLRNRLIMETRFARRDGSPVDVSLLVAPLDSNDPSVGFVGAVREMPAYAQAGKAPGEGEDRFRWMMEQSPISIQIYSPNGDLLSLNEASDRLWGRLKGEKLPSYNIFEDPRLRELGFIEEIRKAFRGELAALPPTEYDVSTSHGAGEKRVLQAVLYPVRDPEGTILQVIVLNLDLTESVRAQDEKAKLKEQLQQAMKMEAVGRLAGGIAHDFNNLLTAISGNAELAAASISASNSPPPHDRILPYLEEISRAAESAAALTHQLLAFSRRQIIEPRVVDLNELMRGMQKMLVRIIGEDVAFTTIEGKELGLVKVDPGELEQVLVNLAVNARDAMPDGGKLTIETSNRDLDGAYCAAHSQTRPGRYVMLAVSDTGQGMTENVKQHVFEPFFTTKPKGRGTGLGLATIFGVIKQAGGAIEVYSEVGLGTTFKIYLPRVEEPVSVASAAPSPPATVEGHETLFVVEDEASIRKLARTNLARLGYNVLLAGSGEEALKVAEAHDGSIDLLMTDVVMSGMNGRELSERLKEKYPRMKVLFTSGYTENVIVHHGVLDRHLSFISKPYTLRALSRKIREVLDAQET